MSILQPIFLPTMVRLALWRRSQGRPLGLGVMAGALAQALARVEAEAIRRRKRVGNTAGGLAGGPSGTWAMPGIIRGVRLILKREVIPHAL